MTAKPQAPAVTAEPIWTRIADGLRAFGVRVSYAGGPPPLRDFSAHAVNGEPGDRGESWPRLFHNLRSSCETELMERFPVHVVARWMGQARGSA